MNFYVKRLFLNSNYKSNESVEKTIYIKSNNCYIKNKFLNTLSNKFYNIKTNYLYFHDDFKTNYINTILMPELNLYISSTITKDPKHTIDLNSTIKNYFKENIQLTKNIINSTKQKFFSTIFEINKLFTKICKKSSNNLDIIKFNNFKNDFIDCIFKNSENNNNFKISEYFVSSIGIEGFKTFSNHLPNGENKVFVINDNFNLFKCLLIDEIINKANFLNISYEIYKNPLNPRIIDHIKIPSINLCIISNTFLFKEKIPGIQINEENFLKNKFENEKLLEQKRDLNNLIEILNSLCKELRKNYSILDDFFENCIIENKFNNLIDDTLKNVIR